METSTALPPRTVTNSRLVDWIAVTFLVGATLLFGGQGIGEGGLGWSDAPQHMMDGAFVLAAAREPMGGDARAWAEQFYLRHPALGFVVYWPPGFAIVEAVFFAIGGVSIATARWCVVTLAAGAVALLYLIARHWIGRRGGLLAALLMLACPHGMLWLADVMIEWPATFWVLLTVWFYLRWREGGSAGAAAGAAAAFVMAFLTKQTAGFIGPVVVLHALLERTSRERMKRPGAIVAGIAALLIIAGYSLFARRYAALPGRLTRFDAADAGYYFRHLDEITGWPMALLAVVGLVALMRSRSSVSGGLLEMWFLGWVGFSSLIAAKEPRYFFFAIPPMAIWAASCASIYLGRFSAGAVVTGFVAGLSLWTAWRSPPVRLPRYEAAVRELAARPDAELVLVDAVRDGQFVVDAYVEPQARERIIPIRASKLLYARAARERFEYEQYVQSPSEIAALLDRYGICYVVMESELPQTEYFEADPPPRRMLRRLVADGTRFELIESWPLRCADGAWDEVELRLYRRRECAARRAEEIELRFPGMGRSVTIPLPKR